MSRTQWTDEERSRLRTLLERQPVTTHEEMEATFQAFNDGALPGSRKFRSRGAVQRVIYEWGNAGMVSALVTGTANRWLSSHKRTPVPLKKAPFGASPTTAGEPYLSADDAAALAHDIPKSIYDAYRHLGVRRIGVTNPRRGPRWLYSYRDVVDLMLGGSPEAWARYVPPKVPVDALRLDQPVMAPLPIPASAPLPVFNVAIAEELREQSSLRVTLQALKTLHGTVLTDEEVLKAILRLV